MAPICCYAMVAETLMWNAAACARTTTPTPRPFPRSFDAATVLATIYSAARVWLIDMWRILSIG
jgi:hypothetical protein